MDGRRVVIPAPLLLTLSIMAGCGEQGGTFTAGETWSLTEEFRLGGREAPPEEIFGNLLTTLSVGPRGNLHVLDHLTSEIRVFDRRGRFVRIIGGDGSGPGEFRAPSAMTWDPSGRLWVANAFDGRYSVFDTAGNFVRTVPRPIHVVARVKHQMHFLDSATLVDETYSDDGVLFLAVDTTGTVVDSFPVVERPGGPTGFLPRSFDRAALSYIPRLVWALAPDGTVWFTRTDELRLIHRTLKGDTLAVSEVTSQPRTLSSETRMWLDREFSKLGAAPPGWEPAFPLAQAVQLLQDGRVLVQIAEVPGEPGATARLFDPRGRFLGTVNYGFPVSPRGLSTSVGDTLLLVGLDPLDVPFVVRGHLQTDVNHEENP